MVKFGQDGHKGGRPKGAKTRFTARVWEDLLETCSYGHILSPRQAAPKTLLAIAVCLVVVSAPKPSRDLPGVVALAELVLFPAIEVRIFNRVLMPLWAMTFLSRESYRGLLRQTRQASSR
jgi:hypothetical protein